MPTELFVERWGAPVESASGVVVLIHGITANSHALRRLALALDEDICVIAPDLRGRGRSNSVGGPYGISQHAQDVLGIVDGLGTGAATLVGHSMGAFVAAFAAAERPDRVSSIVMIDGGLPAPVPDGADPQLVLDAMLGPTLARLSKSFDTFDEYVAFWQTHPAMAEIDDEYLREYSSHDVDPGSTLVRSCADEDAVRFDGAQLMNDAQVRTAAERVQVPLLLCCATRGILNQAEPRVPQHQAREFAESHPNVRTMVVPDTNHFSIIANPDAVATIAHAINNEGSYRDAS